jgi:hypothetical protein
MLPAMDPAAEALAGEPRRRTGAVMDAPDAASWLKDDTAHAAKPPTRNKQIIAALMGEIARGELWPRDKPWEDDDDAELDR